VEKSGGVIGEGECGDADEELLAKERQSLDILSVKKEARLSARALAEVDACRGEEDCDVRICLYRVGQKNQTVFEIR